MLWPPVFRLELSNIEIGIKCISFSRLTIEERYVKHMDAILLFQGAQLGNHIHPFLTSEVTEFANKYEQVYLICSDYSCSDDELRVIKNVQIVRIKLSRAKKMLFHYWICFLIME